MNVFKLFAYFFSSETGRNLNNSDLIPTVICNLNFRKFHVALNPMHRIFLNVASYHAYQKLIIQKKFQRAVFEL